ncbi:MAG: hypothetical protein HY018_13095 [Hydrogenophilales bacterium]|nr:hypothetical protein [Hydrogenophilales bacterium]
MRKEETKSGAWGAAKNPVWQEEERLGMNPYREIYKGNLRRLNIGQETTCAIGIFVQSDVVL